jgi:hypothetical protein
MKEVKVMKAMKAKTPKKPHRHLTRVPTDLLPGRWPTLQDDQILFLIHSPLTIVCGVGVVCVCVCVCVCVNETDFF